MQVNQCAPVYFVVGDGGNEEGPSEYSGQADQVNGLPNCSQITRLGTCLLRKRNSKSAI